jgi:type II secretory pathway pseudopilin PulG
MKRINACRIAGMVLSVLILVLSLTGCVKKKAAESEVTENPLKPSPGGAPAQGVVRRGAQRQVNQQLLRNIGQYYALYRTENGREPRNLQEFLAYLKSDPNARTANVPQALESGWVVMVFTPNPSGNSVLAYEKEAFQQFQNRLVLFGDGNSVKLMTEPEFQAALQAP